jgi:putative SOS response-associated peptidase YedK
MEESGGTGGDECCVGVVNGSLIPGRSEEFVMCGRYAILSAPEAIRALFAYQERPNFPPRYNVAPSQPIPIVRLADGVRQFALVRWGLIPSWVKDPRAFALLINARGESVNEKVAFRNAMRRRRCLVPADGFYEWKREGNRTRPYFVRRKDRKPFAFAGLWETWTGPNGEEMESAAIVVTGASRTLAAVHDRMPVIVPPEAFELWLDCANVDAQTASALIAPAPDGLLEAYEVSPAVNRTANDGATLIEPLGVGAGPAADAAPVAPGEPAETKLAPAPRKRRAKKDDGQASLF